MMEESAYGLRIRVPVPYDNAVERTTAALQLEGFGVLTAIDVRQTLKQKLGQEFRKYLILGACNPPLASRALHAELEIGLLLPCNVVVYEDGPDHSVVMAMQPLAALGLVKDQPEVRAVAVDADARLRRALRALEQTADPQRADPSASRRTPP